MLVRVEELTATFEVPLETALQATEEAESHSLAVLSCDTCRQQRLPLTAVTILCARLVEWLRQSWSLDDEPESEPDAHRAAGASHAASKNMADYKTEHQHPPRQLRKFSLGNYNLDPDEAAALSHELMTLRLTRFSAVLGSLEAALVPPGPSALSSSPGGSTTCPREPAPIAPACLDLVRSNLRLLRTCIRRLKARSLLNTGSSITTTTANPGVFDARLSDRPRSFQASWWR
ncbi:hypothetical protein MPH_09315 [Macrophomina phaseolina MS6]|uniref:Uncharacterized protein n=1 Tax=Macrophomina phaseolina (strain MS6) TaxID=1126212 RepID=K2QV89_MACPH|nr:hypothetical protein MPH_09315 [Macrophomina phaseolina MS6]